MNRGFSLRFEENMPNKVINIITVCLLLVSTTGFSISRHYCGEALIDVAVNKQAETCCSNPDCCDTETDYYQLDDDFLMSDAVSVKPEQVISVDLLAPVHSIQIENNIIDQLVTFTDGISPPVRQHFQAVYQIFLL